jgi:hypothetical protein
VGSLADTEKEFCLGYSGLPCNFTNEKFPKCKVAGAEGFSYNFFQVYTDPDLGGSGSLGTEPNSISENRPPDLTLKG